MKRQLPNILITGTPGTGKSTLSSEVCQVAGMEWLNVGEIAKFHGLYLKYDNQLACHVLDEDKVIDELEDKMAEGGKIVDYHGCDFFPEDWFDIVFVLTANTDKLYYRLVTRGYSGKKLKNNMDCEIFQTLLEEARKAYSPSIVHALPSNTPDDMESNIEQIQCWIEAYKNNNSDG